MSRFAGGIIAILCVLAAIQIAVAFVSNAAEAEYERQVAELEFQRDSIAALLEVQERRVEQADSVVAVRRSETQASLSLLDAANSEADRLATVARAAVQRSRSAPDTSGAVGEASGSGEHVEAPVDVAEIYDSALVARENACRRCAASLFRVQRENVALVVSVAVRDSVIFVHEEQEIVLTALGDTRETEIRRLRGHWWHGSLGHGLVLAGCALGGVLDSENRWRGTALGCGGMSALRVAF